MFTAFGYTELVRLRCKQGLNPFAMGLRRAAAALAPRGAPSCPPPAHTDTSVPVPAGTTPPQCGPKTAGGGGGRCEGPQRERTQSQAPRYLRGCYLQDRGGNSAPNQLNWSGWWGAKPPGAIPSTLQTKGRDSGHSGWVIPGTEQPRGGNGDRDLGTPAPHSPHPACRDEPVGIETRPR